MRTPTRCTSSLKKSSPGPLPFQPQLHSLAAVTVTLVPRLGDPGCSYLIPCPSLFTLPHVWHLLPPHPLVRKSPNSASWPPFSSVCSLNSAGPGPMCLPLWVSPHGALLVFFLQVPLHSGSNARDPGLGPELLFPWVHCCGPCGGKSLMLTGLLLLFEL